MVKEKSKKFKNTQDEYNKALASEDPTKISNKQLEEHAKQAMKKFKSLQ